METARKLLRDGSRLVVDIALALADHSAVAITSSASFCSMKPPATNWLAEAATFLT